jgi:hypothetical protein
VDVRPDICLNMQVSRSVVFGPRAGPLAVTVERTRAVIPFAFAAGVTGLVAADHGGYWPTSWGWATLVLCSAALIALVIRIDCPSPLELAWAGGLLAVCGWTAASMLWTTSRTQTAHEVERSLVYASLALATIALVRRHAVRALLWGAWAGASTVCLYALATRLVPGRVGLTGTIADYRLATPVGYWNGLGLIAATAALLAVGLVVEGRSLLPRALAGASVAVLFPTLYLTFSRGAWVALAAGLLVVITLSAVRLTYVTAYAALGVPAAVGVALAYHARALRVTTAAPQRAVEAGHTLASRAAGRSPCQGCACRRPSGALTRWRSRSRRSPRSA